MRVVIVKAMEDSDNNSHSDDSDNGDESINMESFEGHDRDSDETLSYDKAYNGDEGNINEDEGKDMSDVSIAIGHHLE
jgi:hypothetical protein